MGKKSKNQPRESKEIFESPEAIANKISKTEEFVARNKNIVLTILGIIVVSVAGFFAYRSYINGQNELAQSELFQAVYYFEMDSLDKALNGDGNNFGLLDIARDYSWTKAGNLANFYIGVSYLKKVEFENAIEYLGKFNSDDLVIQARAFSLIGDAYMELGNYYDALDYYNQAIDYKPNKYFTPQYLIKAAVAYEKLNDFESAKKCYKTIVDEYYDSDQFTEARKQEARLKGLAS